MKTLLVQGTGLLLPRAASCFLPVPGRGDDRVSAKAGVRRGGCWPELGCKQAMAPGHSSFWLLVSPSAAGADRQILLMTLPVLNRWISGALLSDQLVGPCQPASPTSRPEVFNEMETGLTPWRRKSLKKCTIRYSAGVPRELHLKSMVVNTQYVFFLGSVPPGLPGSGLPSRGSGQWINRLCHRKIGKGTAPRAIRENAALLFTDGLTRVSRDDSRWGPDGPGVGKGSLSRQPPIHIR